MSDDEPLPPFVSDDDEDGYEPEPAHLRHLNLSWTLIERATLTYRDHLDRLKRPYIEGDPPDLQLAQLEATLAIYHLLWHRHGDLR